MKLYSQENISLRAMFSNKWKIWWSAKDFQSGKYFVGYEASARMSGLMRYPFIQSRKDGRFRIISINWKEKKAIKDYKEKLKENKKK